ncbi:hypothetical protein C8Q77DRAFT_1159104 [Trametes polyzona]|nr:hypothetical protein C8Q77DRAFT_1159104 [Trametes polyzona]
MAPTMAQVLAALQCIVDHAPGLEADFFNNTYSGGTKDIRDELGNRFTIERTGLTRSTPRLLGFCIDLKALSPAPKTKYNIWLKDPTADTETNRQAFIDGLKYVISRGGMSLTHTVEMESAT